jgi:hypothetical protein
MRSDGTGTCSHDECSLSDQMLKPTIIVLPGKGSQGETVRWAHDPRVAG